MASTKKPHQSTFSDHLQRTLRRDSELRLEPSIESMDRVARLASERAVVVFTASNSSMCDVVTSLLGSLGVNAAVHELDRDPRGREMERELARMLGGGAGRGVPTVPAVFVGGDLVGGTNRVMALHLAGELVPMLRSAGALWL
ncbi:Glutaredoxin-C10 [Dichanthelium oligosanthes]|uniref:Glutaredoxin-C10 n=1 Tax=Dichanthelium oligosanthes TaxID=888268 RepID=A0A1E5V833_9POAL|nr:Glutaredoxin-C10 [Dichanthelium oligosanthes]